jgi:hypothetical protein
MRQCGIDVSPQLLKLSGRKLPPPTLYLGGGGREVPPPNTQWKLPRKQFSNPRPITCWAVLAVEGQRDHDFERNVEQFVQDLAMRLRGLGARVVVARHGNELTQRTARPYWAGNT